MLDLVGRMHARRGDVVLPSDSRACRGVDRNAAGRDLVGHIMPACNGDDRKTVRALMMGRVLGTRRRRT
jgi:hypothetical protein